MLSAAFYFKLAIYWTPGHDWYPLTVSFPLFYLLFSLHSITFLTTTTFLSFSFYQGRRIRAFAVASIDRRWCGLWDTRHSCCGLWRAPVLLRLLLHPFSNGLIHLVRWLFGNDGIPLCCCCYLIHCRSSLTRTFADASYFERGTDRRRVHACCCILFDAVHVRRIHSILLI